MRKAHNKIPTKDLINQKYGRLTIIEEIKPHIQPSGDKKRKFLCMCECGIFTEAILNNLRKGNTKSCGCLQLENRIKHNLSKHPLYRLWIKIKHRCYNLNFKQYKDYGGRGITVCDKWLNDPERFIRWALANGYKKGLCIDRINNNGNYEANNCRFVDRELSNKNQRLLRSNNKSGYRGVSWDKKAKKWCAEIYADGKSKHLGCFNSLRLAALRYDAEATLLNDGRPINHIK